MTVSQAKLGNLRAASAVLASALVSAQLAACAAENTGQPLGTGGQTTAGGAAPMPPANGAAGGPVGGNPVTPPPAMAGGTAGVPPPPPAAGGSGGNMTPPSTGGAAAGGAGGAAAGGMVGAGGSGGAAMDLVLVGPPPTAQMFGSSNGQHFELLPDDDMFTTFQAEGARVQILPVDARNFPPGFDWTNAPGKDVELNEKMQWARARLTAQAKANLKTWYYDVTIDICGESDGDSAFALALNNKIAVEAAAMPSDSTTCGQHKHTWQKVAIRAEDVIEIWGQPVSNLIHTEGAGPRKFSPTYAWARGRWYGVEFAPTPGVQ